MKWLDNGQRIRLKNPLLSGLKGYGNVIIDTRDIFGGGIIYVVLDEDKNRSRCMTTMDDIVVIKKPKPS